MNKIIIVLLSNLMFFSQPKAQGINFERNLTWDQVKAKAKLQNKYILMDTYTTWCGPCKAMSENIFPQKEVGDSINALFISVKVQMDKTKDDDEYAKSWYADAKAIDQQYKITGYPTVLFFSPEGKLVSRAVGYRDGPGLIAEAKIALDPKTQFYTLLGQYKKGKMDTAAMKALVYQADGIGDKKTARKIAEDYAGHLKKTDLYKKENLLFIGTFLNGSKDRNFNIFFKEATRVNKIVERKNYAEGIIMGIVSREEIDIYTQEEKPDWSLIEKKIKSKYGSLGMERFWGSRMLNANDKADWANFGKYYQLYFEQAVKFERSFVHINNMSWPVVEHVSDPAVLATAIKTMKYDIEKFDSQNFQALDTYANLLYKTGKKAEAIEWEEKAVQLSNNDKELVETLKKMKAGVKIW